MIANTITFSRIIFSFCILFFSPLSIKFYVFFILASFTDMIDGMIARKMKTQSDFGEKSDTASDIILSLCVFIKIIPAIKIKVIIIIWIIFIALLKICNILLGIIKTKKFVAVHSVLNKLTGVILFVFVILLKFMNVNICSTVLCIFATISAIDEFNRIKKMP